MYKNKEIYSHDDPVVSDYITATEVKQLEKECWGKNKLAPEYAAARKAEEEFLQPILDKMLELANVAKDDMGRREPGEICMYEIPPGTSYADYKLKVAQDRLKQRPATTLADTPK